MHRVYRTQGPSDAQMRKMVDNLAEKTGDGAITYGINYVPANKAKCNSHFIHWGDIGKTCESADSWPALMDKYFEIMEG